MRTGMKYYYTAARDAARAFKHRMGCHHAANGLSHDLIHFFAKNAIGTKSVAGASELIHR